MTTANETTPAPLRVLVVENDPQGRADHLKNLTSWGYAAWAAESIENTADRFQSLWDDAIAKAKRYRCHLALVDMRLRNDDDPADTSGLRLVQHLAPTVSIIVSSFGNAKTVRAALNPPPKIPVRACDFVGKEDGPEALREAVQEVERTFWQRRHVKLLWSDGLSPLTTVHQLFPADHDIPEDEIEDLFRRLFPQASRIALEPFDHLERSGCQAGETRSNAVLLHAFLDDAQIPALVKIGRVDTILREVEQYHKLLVGSLRIRRPPPLAPTILWDMGAQVYDLSAVVHPLKTLESAFDQLDVAGVKGVLGDVVQMLVPWQDHERPLDASLFDSYLREYREDLTEHARNDRPPGLKMLDVDLPAPISWVLARQKDSDLPGLRMSISHGRLRTDSVLVGADGDVYLINFENTGYGHILQDIASLEADILIRLTSELDSVVFLDLAVVLAQRETRSRWLRSTLQVDTNPNARKVLETVLELRNQASEAFQFSNRQEYLWALLLTTVKRMVDLGVKHPCYTRAWLLGSVLCERIASEGAGWPTKPLKRVGLLTPAELEDRRYEIGRLQQQLRLLRVEQSYSRMDSPEIKYTIDEVTDQLQDLGLDPRIVETS